MGGMLAPLDLQHGARGGKAKSGVTAGNSTPTLPEMGITKKEAPKRNSPAGRLCPITIWSCV